MLAFREGAEPLDAHAVHASSPVAFTSKTRSRISMIDTSKVPPPRS